ncbi:ABC transporter substrate-binding protein [Pseudonocardia halophobica]|uniref:ABC transporter substrate-binding protein n=1 Tax=Pseudonocardia halophobica TaxID=29401 RepID=UPI003D8BDA1B
MRPTRSLFAAAAVALLSVTAACGSGGGASTGSAGKPSEFAIDFVLDVTGVSQTFSPAVRQGWDLRIEQANAAKELRGTTLSTNVHDTRSDPRTGAGLMAEVGAGEAPLAVFGTSSSVAPAVAPVAQQAGLPLVTIYSGSPGVVDAGDHVFRVTAPQYTYHHLQSEYFKANGVKRVAIVYNNDIGTLKDLAENYYPKAAAQDGYEIVQSSGVSAKAPDLSSEMTGVLGSNPDAVLMLVLGQQNTSIVTQLRRASFPGVIAAQPGVGNQALLALGPAADGIVYPIDFSAATTSAAGKDFVNAYQARYGSAPDTFAASGYDGASMAVAALAAAPEFTREALLQSISDITAKGLDGASGTVRFDGRDARVDGMMVRWENGRETLVAPPA